MIPSRKSLGLLILMTFVSGILPAVRPKILFLTGDEEYRSEESMPMLAQILRRDFEVDVEVGFSVDEDGYIDPYAASRLTGWDKIAEADLVVLFLRFRRPEETAFTAFLKHLRAGKPVVAFRTSTHAFRFAADSPHADWGYQNDPEFMHSFAGGAATRELVGQKWITHHGHFSDGHDPLTEVTLPPTATGHSILRGVQPFAAYSWLYHVEGGGDTVAGNPEFLLNGRSLRSNHAAKGATDRYPLTNPVAWTKFHHGDPDNPARVFTTTLGHPYDFKLPAMRRLALQGILWALGKEDVIPINGVNVDPVTPYAPHNSGFGPETFKGRKKPADFFPPATNSDDEITRPVHEQPIALSTATDPVTLPLHPSEQTTIAIVGGALGERMQYHGFFESTLQAAFPALNMRVRNLAASGDTPGLRPHPGRSIPWAFPGAAAFHPEHLVHRGAGHYPSPDEWLTIVDADVILGCFGYSESFAGAAGLDRFKAELRAWIAHTRTRSYNGTTAPTIVLVSPIAFEDRSAASDLPDGSIQNIHLAAYTEVLMSIAAETGVAAIDAFTPSQSWFEDHKDNLTVNGAHLNATGYRVFSNFLAKRLWGDAIPAAPFANASSITAAVSDKNWLWDNDYRMRNGVHVHGRRWAPFGEFNYPEEIEKIRQMTALRDQAIWAAARGDTVTTDDSTTRSLSPVTTNFDRPIHYLDEDNVMAKFTTAPGFAIDLFASEETFPDLANPVQITFDTRGRLWVAVMPSYPHYRPGDTRPNDKLLIFEDTDGDGRADQQTTFAEGLHLPIGFSLQPDGSVIVSQQPKLIRLRDTNGDDRADESEILLTGWDTHDTHHAIGAFETGPDGALYLLEGVFLHSQVETPYGTERGVEANVWRFNPRTHRLEKFSAGDYDNPWGLAFNDYGQPFLADASNGRNNWLTPMSARLPHGEKHPQQNEFTTQKVRPTAGAAFVSSRHFPADQQGDFLVANTIGFLGIKQHIVVEDGAGYTGELRQDLLFSSDPNFRPVDLEFAPDGSLYVVDWHNALVGHMQHSARDPNRDQQHGRIFRITHSGPPLLTPPPIAGAPIEQLLRNLSAPEYQTRVRTRRELLNRSESEFIGAWQSWLDSIDKSDGRSWLEALWHTASTGDIPRSLLDRCLNHADPRVRAAAVRVSRHARHDDPAATAHDGRRAANDAHPRVRAEAIALASWLEDTRAGAEIFLTALRHPVDQTFAAGVEAVFKTLGPAILSGEFDLTDTPTAASFLEGTSTFVEPDQTIQPPVLNLSAEGIKRFNAGREIYQREAHCATCHQPDGRGLPGIYPPLGANPWVQGDHTRLIKIALKGLWGPLDVNGETFDPANGVPPMPGFEGLLTDEELAAVLTYVITAFGTWGSGGMISPEEVAAVRAATRHQVGHYMVEELLEQHPLEP